MQRNLRFLRDVSWLVFAAFGTLAESARAETVQPAAIEPPSADPSPAPRQPLVFAPRDEDPEAAAPEETLTTSERAAAQGLLAPFTQSPQIGSARVVAKGTAGFDGALNAFVARTSAEARVLPFLALRLDFDHGPSMGPENRFGVGARVQLLRQAAQGVDGALGLAYQPNDFRQEGHIVGSVLLGRSFGRLYLSGNGLFGGDPEGDDQAAEARASAVYRVVQRFHLGIDSRFRYNTSDDEKRAGTQISDWELQATPTASYGLGPIALLGLAGLSVIQTTGPFGAVEEETKVHSGVVAMAGAAGAF